MGVVKGAISLTDNATAVLRGIRKEQSAFRKDVETTKSALKSTWGQKYQARLDATAASKTLSQLKSKMDPLKKKVVTAVAVKEMATAKLKTVGEKMKAVGKMVAQRAIEKGITTVVFDRGGYIFHGRVRELAEGAREGGLNF